MLESKIKGLEIFIQEAVAQVEPKCTFSFLEGIEHALNDFSIYQDGDRVFGALEYTTKELAEAIRRYADGNL